MNTSLFAQYRNGRSLPLKSVPELPLAAFREAIVLGIQGGGRLACLCADAELRLFAVLADDTAGILWINRTRLDAPKYPSLTPECPQAHLFEREMAEQFGIMRFGHRPRVADTFCCSGAASPACREGRSAGPRASLRRTSGTGLLLRIPGISIPM